VFNTQAVCLVDLNNDGLLDVVFNNEGQESAVLLGDKEVQPKRTPLTLQVAGTAGVVGSCVKVLDKEGKALGCVSISGGDGRGGQAAPQARFALPPGTYRVEVQYSSGVRRAKGGGRRRQPRPRRHRRPDAQGGIKTSHRRGRRERGEKTEKNKEERKASSHETHNTDERLPPPDWTCSPVFSLRSLRPLR